MPWGEPHIPRNTGSASAPVDPPTVAPEPATEIPQAAIAPGCAHRAAYVEPTTEPTVADVDKWWRCPDCGFRFQRNAEPGTPAWYEEIRADPDRACEHEHFEAGVDVQRLTKDEEAGVAVGPVEAFIAEVRVTCAQCGEKFRFLGLDFGAGGATPTCTIDETLAHLPMRPASADPDFGLGVPALAIRVLREERGCDENDPRHELATRLATNVAISSAAFGLHGVELGTYDCDADPLGLREAAMHAIIGIACNGLLDYDAVLADDQ